MTSQSTGDHQPRVSQSASDSQSRGRLPRVPSLQEDTEVTELSCRAPRTASQVTQRRSPRTARGTHSTLHALLGLSPTRCQATSDDRRTRARPAPALITGPQQTGDLSPAPRAAQNRSGPREQRSRTGAVQEPRRRSGSTTGAAREPTQERRRPVSRQRASCHRVAEPWYGAAGIGRPASLKGARTDCGRQERKR